MPVGARGRYGPDLVMPRRRLLALSFVSGVCGIAYELLYSRLLTTYLGDMLQVSAAILTCFLMGIGLGSWLAIRWSRWLWVIEASIGLYGIACAFAVPMATDRLLAGVLAHTSNAPVLLLLSVVLVLAVPTFLIGCSVPLFASWVAAFETGVPSTRPFAWVYGLYNLGAGVCVLALEFLVLRKLGVSGAMVTIGATNLVTSLALRLGCPLPPEEVAAPTRPPPDARLLVVLALVSAASAVYQLVILRTCSTIFGPFHENFAIALALGMAGLALGPLLVERFKIGFGAVLIAGALLFTVGACATRDIIDLWARMSGATVGLGDTRLFSKIFIATLLALPSLTVFGATIPALLRDRPRSDPGLLLAVSSFGNCAGYLLAVLFLFERTTLLTIVVAIGLVLFAGGLASEGVSKRWLPAVVLGQATLLVLLGARWPSAYFSLADIDFRSLETLTAAERGLMRTETVKRRDGEVDVVHTRSGVDWVVINGYRSLAASSSGELNHRELIVGVAPSVYPRERHRALVLGTGTGLTAGAAAMLFDSLTVVEISPAVQAALPLFSAHNFDLLHRPNVTLLVRDGMSVVAEEGPPYDAIISTVTSPLYFSSSKLYTLDFFTLVKKRLAPGGVFAFWFDERLSAPGLRIILQTMVESFRECHFAFLHGGYYEAICSPDTLSPSPRRDDAWPADLARALASWAPGGSVNRLLEAVLLRPRRFTDRTWSDTANTFDLPVLEHLMARESLVHGERWDLDGAVDFDLDDSVFGGTPFAGENLQDRCATLASVGAGRGLDRCLPTLLGRTGGVLPAAYVVRAATALEAGLSSAMPAPAVVTSLTRGGDASRALALLERAREANKDDLAYQYARLRMTMDVRGDVDDDDVAHLVALGAMAPEVHVFLSDLAMKRGKPRQALDHLSFARQLGGALDAGHERLEAQLVEAVRKP
jgi:predicted membrane-bound spermidine synthase